MENHARATEYVTVSGGSIAYDVAGEGPLVVLSPGLADTRAAYRFLAPLLVNAGYRVATVDLRGHGESSTGWATYSHADTAGDVLAVVDKLGGPAIIVGQSFSAGAATLAAATAPQHVSAVVEIGPFTRPQGFSMGALLRNDHGYRSGGLPLARFAFTGSLGAWSKYLRVAYPDTKPADWEPWLAGLMVNLAEPGRVKAAQQMMNSRPSAVTMKEAGERLKTLDRPVLVVMGSHDSDFADPHAEAAGIVADVPAGLGEYVIVPSAGHYPHAQFPQLVADAMIPFLKKITHA